MKTPLELATELDSLLKRSKPFRNFHEALNISKKLLSSLTPTVEVKEEIIVKKSPKIEVIEETVVEEAAIVEETTVEEVVETKPKRSTKK